MKRTTYILSVILLLVSFQGCNKSLKEQVPKDNMDFSTRPQDDFYTHINGLWIQKAKIADNDVKINSFSELEKKVKNSLEEIVQDASQKDSASLKEKQIANLYKSYINTDLRDAKGTTPLQEKLQTIAKASNHKEIIKLFASLNSVGVSTPIAYDISNDDKNSQHYITHFYHFGTRLPNKLYYSSQEARFSDIREKYKAYIASLMRLSGFEDSQSLASDILALETKISEIEWSDEDNYTPEKSYNKFTKEKAKELFGSFDFQTYLELSNLNISEMIIRQPSYFRDFAVLFEKTPVSLWRDYLAYLYINSYANFLSSDFEDLKFNFFSKTLLGIKELSPIEERGVGLVDYYLGDTVGELYVQKHSSTQAKTKVLVMTQNILDVFRTSISQLDWMSEPTKVAALVKLNKITIKIGYPDKWEDYSSIDIKADDLVGNIENYAKWHNDKELKKLGTLMDKTEWSETPQTVNAFYNPYANEIIFPAAILQAPFFDVDADDAINYGAIGSIIGHELTHAFDNRGSKFDADGNLFDWWSESDKKAFAKLSKSLVEQFNSYKPFDDVNISVNGVLTLSENIADLGGVSMSHKAYKNSIKTTTLINGYTNDQRFFIGYAKMWASKARDEYLKNSLLTDVHSPAIYRVNGVLTNYSDFYKAFDVKPGDKLYKSKAQRIKIW